MSRWTIGLIIGFSTVFVANGILIYFAVSGAPEIEQSYLDETAR